MTPTAMRHWPARVSRRSSRPGATCAGSGRGSGGITASAGSTGPTPGLSTPRCGPGATYPEQVIFAKGHGTQNDFVLLVDVNAKLSLVPAGGAAPWGRPPRPRG